MTRRATIARRGVRLGALAGAGLLLSGCLGWGQPGYDPGRTGHNPSERTLTAATVANLAPAWQVTGYPLRTVSSGGHVHVLGRFTSTSQLDVRTVDAETGEVAWSRQVGNYDLGSYLAVVGDVLAVSLSNQQESMGPVPPPVHLVNEGFDPATGEGRPHPFGVSEYPSTDGPGQGDTVIGSHVAVMQAGLDLRVTWDGTRPDTYIPNLRDPLLEEGAGVVVGTSTATGTTIEARPLECATEPCQPLWSHPGRSATSALSRNPWGVYVAGDQLEVLELSTGATAWTAPVASDVRPAVRDGNAFLVSRGGELVAVPWCTEATCAPAWSADLPDGASLSPVVGGDVAYVATTAPDGLSTRVTAYAADGCGTATCAPLATVTADGAAHDLLVAGGRLVVQTSRGAYAFGLPG